MPEKGLLYISENYDVLSGVEFYRCKKRRDRLILSIIGSISCKRIRLLLSGVNSKHFLVFNIRHIHHIKRDANK